MPRDTCNYYGDISPQSSDVYGANASWHSLSPYLSLSWLVLLLLVILLFLCKSLHMAKLLSTIYQSYRPWLQINNGILIAYRKRKERERDGVCSIRFSVCCTCRLPQASGGWGNLLKLVRDCPCLLNVSCVSCPVLSCLVFCFGLCVLLTCALHMSIRLGQGDVAPAQIIFIFLCAKSH